MRTATLPIWHAINPYLDFLKRALQTAGVENSTPRQLCSARAPEVVLVHWQENLWADPGAGVKQRLSYPVRRRLLLAALRSWRRRGGTVIWFAHNQKPHAWQGPPEQWARRSRPFFAEVDAVAHLTRSAMHLPGFAHIAHLPAIVVRHPHYELVGADEHAAKAGTIGRVLLLGGLERRKNGGAAVRAILKTDHLTAVVTGDGKATDPVLTAPRVMVIEGLVDDAELRAMFDGHTVVLLNQDEQINSGVMYLALSRGAPVLCPDTPVNNELQSLVGPEWIRLFRPPLTAAALRELTEQPIPTALPDLSPFSPVRIGQDFVAAVGSIRDAVPSESFGSEPPGSLEGAIDLRLQSAENS